MADPPELLISDAEREQAVGRLREASGEGRLTLEELSDRVESAYNARTAGELAAVTADLPAGPSASPARAESGWVLAFMGAGDRRGRWRLWRRTRVVAVMGGSNLDLREAEIDGPEIEITAVALMGGIDVIVSNGVEVDLSGFAVMGANGGPGGSGPRHRGAPVVRVRAYSLMGGVNVKRNPASKLSGAQEAPQRG